MDSRKEFLNIEGGLAITYLTIDNKRKILYFSIPDENEIFKLNLK